MIILDTTWARLAGARRTAGVYQMQSRELLRRLIRLQQVQIDETPAAATDAVPAMMVEDRTPTPTPS